MRIGFLPFYVNYYEQICATFPVEKAEAARSASAALAAFGEVVWDGALIGDVEAASAAGVALAAQSPDCVVVLTTIAVFGSIPWAALEKLGCPILIWNAQRIETVDDDYSMVEIVRNTGQIGVQALANTLLRNGRAFRVITGYERSERTKLELDRYFRTITAVSAVRNARLLAVGSGFPGMTDIDIDEASLARDLGPTVTRIDAAGLTDAYRGVSATAMEAHDVSIAADRWANGISDDEKARSIRLAEALRGLALTHSADAGTLNCHAGNCLRNPEIGITACYALGDQNALGRSFTCTGDLPTAIAMLLMKRLTGTAMYTEVQVMDERRCAIVLANSGEGEDGMRRSSSPAAIGPNSNFAGLHGRGASFAYPLAAGPATVVSFTPTPNGPKSYRLIVAEGEIIDETLPDIGSLAGFFRFSGCDLHDGYTRWLEAGPVHHAATSPGHWSRELAYAAQLLNIEYVNV